MKGRALPVAGLLLAAGLLVAAGALLTSSAPAEEPKPAALPQAPRLAVEPAAFDFGRVLPQRTVQKEFSIRNFGGSDLVIENVSTTCGCTAALMDSKVVKPGRTTPLRVTVETRTYSGRVARSVMIRSNDPARPLLEVRVEATVVPEPAAPKK